LIVWVNVAETLVSKLVLPLYVAVIECVPCDNDFVVKAADPLLSVTVASVVAPSLNVTVPVGVPVNWGATFAVNVTFEPSGAGFSDEVNVVLLVALLTFCERAAEVLARYVPLPAYAAVME
jgi:hypothetical protein